MSHKHCHNDLLSEAIMSIMTINKNKRRIHYFCLSFCCSLTFFHYVIIVLIASEGTLHVCAYGVRITPDVDGTPVCCFPNRF